MISLTERITMDELQALIKELRELIATLKQQPTIPVSPVVPPVEEVYPRVVEFDGAKFNLYRPINPKWKPSQAAKMFGKYHVLNDPSLETTPNGYPSRSPMGYPLVYPFVKDGKPYKDAVILFGENTYPNDAAVEDYIKATSKTAEQLEAERKQWEEYDRKKLEAIRNDHPTSTNPPSNPPTDPDIIIL
jgi:hypothetical protein